MESPVEVVLPAAVAERLMGSQEGFGSGGGSGGGVAIGEVRWHVQGACSSGDDIHAINVSAPAFLRKIPDSELGLEARPPSSLHSDVISDERGFGNMKSISSTLDRDAKPIAQNSGKVVRKNSGSTKRSGMVQMEVSKSKSGLRDVKGISPELASSSASCNISEKNQLVKEKNSSISKRGDKRNSKAKNKIKCDFSLKNGLIGFNSAAGGNNFLGIYGLKPDEFDITKHVNELSLDELLHGNYDCPVAKDKVKKAANPNTSLLQSVRSAWSVLQAPKVSPPQNCGEIDGSCLRNFSTGLVTVSSAIAQTDGNKIDGCTGELPSSDKFLLKAQESDEKIKLSNIADFPLHKPKDVLECLALPPPKDLDLLLSDTGKNTSSSKNSTDHRPGKQVSHRTGLPPFPWSHSFSGHNKLGSDAVKLSTTRTICQGRWVKVKPPAFQKGSADLLTDFESLSFDQSLVPSSSFTSNHPANEFAPIERVLSASGACSTSKIIADEHSIARAAAQTLLDIAAFAKGNPCASVKSLKRHPQTAIKACKSKAIEQSDKLLDQAPKSTKRPTNPLKGEGFSSKKLKLSTDVTTTTNGYYISHTEPVKRETFKPPPRKVYRDSNANTDIYGANIVKKPFAMKTQRREDKPASSKPKIWKSFE
ncbi:hypothetical protein ABFS82_05G106800 [Erythranthe guttata]